MRKAIVITLGVIIGVTGVLAICAHLADAAKLHHRQSRLLMEPFQIGYQRTGAADAVAENVAALGIIGRVIGHGGPLVRRQQQGGVQHHRGVLPGDIPDDGAPLSLSCGEVGKAVQIALQLRLHTG